MTESGVPPGWEKPENNDSPGGHKRRSKVTTTAGTRGTGPDALFINFTTADDFWGVAREQIGSIFELTAIETGEEKQQLRFFRGSALRKRYDHEK